MTGIYQRLRRWLAQLPVIENGRRRRYELFTSRCVKTTRDSLLDVGCGWGTLLERYNRENPITAFDLLASNGEAFNDVPNVTFVRGDATDMPFGDGSFDVVFSNSVIEHVPVELHQAFAREVRRVGRRYFVQTPNRHFPIEPHYWLPFVQYAPQRLQDWLAHRFTDDESIHLLTAAELEALFPDAEVVRERFLGLTKSLIACRD